MRFVILFFFTVVIVYCSAFPTPPNPMVPSAVIRRIDELEQEEPPHPQWNTISAMVSIFLILAAEYQSIKVFVLLPHNLSKKHY